MPNLLSNIASAANPKLKHLKKLLTDKAYRLASQEFVIEGPHLFQYVQGLKSVFIAEDFSEKNFSWPEAIPVYRVPREVLQKISEVEQTQGILGVCARRVCQTVDLHKSYIYFDQLQDPGNMGTLLRTAAAFGLGGAIFGAGCVDPFSPKVVRSTMGAIFNLELVELKELKSLKDCLILVADKNGRPAGQYKPPMPFILVIGSESRGVSAEVRALARETLGLPITSQVESLNAAVAGGILMYELTKKY